MPTYRNTLLCACLAGALGALAGNPARVATEPGVFHPVLSPDASTLLYSTVDHTGLKALDIASGKVTVIDTEAAAGFSPVWSTDCKTVYYRTATLNDGLLYRDVRSFDISKRHRDVIDQPSRRKVNLAERAAENFAVSNFSTITVALNGKTAEISPVENAHSYLWPSLSPDNRKLAFSEPFEGVFVSDSNGQNPVKLLPKGDYVCWAGPKTIVAVVTHDDGYVILDSQLVAVNVATGIVTPLTDETIKVGEATAAPSGLVLFTDLEGNLYSIDIND